VDQPVVDRGDSVSDVGWSPQGEYIAYVKTNTLKLFKFDGSSLIVTGDSKTYSSSDIRFDWSADGQWLAVVSNGDAIDVVKWDFSEDYQAATSISSSNSDVAWFNNSLKFAALDNSNMWLFKFDLTNVTLLNSISTSNGNAVDVSFDDKFICVGYTTASNNVAIFDAETLQEIDRITSASGSQVNDIAFNPVVCCGKHYILAGSFGEDVEVVEYDSQTQTLSLVDDVPVSIGVVGSAQWAPNGRYFAVSGDEVDATIYKFDPQDVGNEITYVIDVSSGIFDNSSLFYLDWSPCGRYIVTHGVGHPLFGTTTRITEVGDCATNCVVEKNNIACCTSDVCGIGIFGATYANLIDANVACCNGINLSAGVFNRSLQEIADVPRSLRNLQEGSCCGCN